MCAHCSSSVENTFKRVGIEAKVNLSKNTVRFTYDDEKTPLKYLARLVKQQGYTLIIDENNNKHKFSYKIFEIVVSVVVLVVSLLGMINMILMNENTFNLHINFFMFFDSNLIKLIFSTISLLVLGSPFIYRAIMSFKMKRVGMDLLISLSSLSSYILSVVLLVLDPINLLNPFKMGCVTYFDSTMMILSIVFIGHNLTDIIKNKSVSSLHDVSNLIPTKALKVVSDKENKLEEVDVDLLEINDICFVKVGDSIPCDGIVIEGNGEVDEKVLTGESVCREVKEGDKVFLSTKLVSGPIQIKLIKTTSNSLMSNIVNESYALDNKKGNLSKISDTIASFFVLVIVCTAVVSFLLNYFLLCKGDIATSIIRTITVLVVSCPCAFGLATPLSSLNGFYLALKNGVLFKNGDIFEQVKNIKLLFFDKTGTLTKGNFVVSKCTIPNEYYSLIYDIEKLSNHPISKGIISYLENVEFDKSSLLDPKEIKEIIGVGFSYKNYKLGSKKLITDEVKVRKEDSILLQTTLNKSIVCFLKGDELLGLMLLEDELADNAKEAIIDFKKDNIKPVLISGDTKSYTLEVGKELGFDENNIYYEVLPEKKKDIIESYITDEKMRKATCYVGDGVNDILALSSVNLKIASYKASEITKSKANCIMLKEDVSVIYKAIIISKKVYINIIFNFVWAFLYNTCLIPLAILGIVNPTLSALLMICSSLTLIINASFLKLVKFNSKRKTRKDNNK